MNQNANLRPDDEGADHEKDIGPPDKGAPDNKGSGMPGETGPAGQAGSPDKGNDPPKRPDPFDPASFRLHQDFANTGGVVKHFTSIPAKRPGMAEWFRLHPGEGYRLDAMVFEHKEEGSFGGETYLITGELQAELMTMPLVTPRRLFFGVTRAGNPFIWPVKLPRPDGRSNAWSESALEVAQAAMSDWVRVQAGGSAYLYFSPPVKLSDPQWPPLTFSDALRLAYRDRVIDTMDHIVLQKLRGEV